MHLDGKKPRLIGHRLLTSLRLHYTLSRSGAEYQIGMPSIWAAARGMNKPAMYCNSY